VNESPSRPGLNEGAASGGRTSRWRSDLRASRWRSDLRASLDLDRSKLQWRWAAIGAVLTSVVVAIGIAAGRDDFVVSVAIGMAFTAIASVGALEGDKWRSMSWATFWMSIAATVGQLLSQAGEWRILYIAVAGFVFGFLGIAGARASLIGVLSLVVFIVFNGGEQSGSLSAALVTGSALAMGGLLIFVAGAITKVANSRSILRASRPRPGFLTRVRNTELRGEYLRHAIRLSIALVIAGAIAFWFKREFDFPHDYWIPMTVAWVARPDFDGTVSRVIARVVGTVVGVAAAALGIEVLDAQGFGLTVLVGIGTWVALVFVWSNYAVAVIGVTVLVLSLFAVEGDRSWTSLGVRLLATVIAGLIVIVVSELWRKDGVEGAR